MISPITEQPYEVVAVEGVIVACSRTLLSTDTLLLPPQGGASPPALQHGHGRAFTEPHPDCRNVGMCPVHLIGQTKDRPQPRGLKLMGTDVEK